MSRLTLPRFDQSLGTGPSLSTGSRVDLLRWLRDYTYAFAALLALVLLCLTLIFEKGSFGLTDQLASFAPLAIAAMASAPAILSGAFDFTTSPLLFFGNGVFVVWLYGHGLGGWYSVPIVLALTTAVGLGQGLLVLVLRAQTVVVTLSLYFIFIGVDYDVVPQPVPVGPSWVKDLAGNIGPIPGPLIMILAPLVIWTALRVFPIFDMMYAVGSNEATAFSAGVRISTVQIFAYGVGGLFAGIGGLAYTAVTGTADSTNVTSYTLIAIAAVVLGGNSLWGGRGTLIGPLLGAASIFLLEDVLTDLNVNPSWLQVTYGLLLVVAVLLSGLLTVRRKGGPA
jgi:ribose transport system permease protein